MATINQSIEEYRLWTFLHRDELPKSGFAGAHKHQLVTAPKAFSPDANMAGYVRAS